MLKDCNSVWTMKWKEGTLLQLLLRHVCDRSTSFVTVKRIKAAPSYLTFSIGPALILSLVASTLILPASATNFTQCMIEVKSGVWGSTGGTDNNGNPVANIADATAITYDLCVRACGSEPQPFNWSTFAQQFNAWLLPWLALVSQLPFGASLPQDNLLSMLLVLGSPTLAAYSLVLVALNGQWVSRRFRKIKYPNSEYAVRILRNLQQVPLRIITDDCLLASLVVLHQNDPWWKDLSERLEYTHTWSLAAVVSILGVIIAYVFTLVDSFTNIAVDTLNSTGQGVGTVWLWLLPIVAGWLLLSPKSDYHRVNRAFKHANKLAYVATPAGVVPARGRPFERYAISLQEYYDGSVFRAHECTPPVFHYALFLPWVKAVEEVHVAFVHATNRAIAHEPVDKAVTTTDMEWTDGKIEPSYRMGSAEQVENYCPSQYEGRHFRLGPNVISRMVIASLLALGLQWGTSGAAIIVQWYTPTRGLGCRSGSYLLYASVSTFIWMALVISSLLAHYSSFGERQTVETGLQRNSPASEVIPLRELSEEGMAAQQPHEARGDAAAQDPLLPNDHVAAQHSPPLVQHVPYPESSTPGGEPDGVIHPSTTHSAEKFSILLRRVAYVLATLNAIWLVLSCLFQLTNFFDRCYCDSSYLGLRSKAYAVFHPNNFDVSIMKSAWYGGVGLGAGCALLFFGFVRLYIPPQHSPLHE